MTTKWDRYEKDLVDRAYEEAYQAWLEEKDMILEQLNQACLMIHDKNNMDNNEAEIQKRILNAIKFIERCNQ